MNSALEISLTVVGIIAFVWLFFGFALKCANKSWFFIWVLIRESEEGYVCEEEKRKQAWENFISLPADLLDILICGPLLIVALITAVIIVNTLMLIPAVIATPALLVLHGWAWVLRDLEVSNSLLDIRKRWAIGCGPLFRLPMVVSHWLCVLAHYLILRRTIKYIAFGKATGRNVDQLVSTLSRVRLYGFNKSYETFVATGTEQNKEGHLRKIS
jgi:hypothetical protein